MNTFKKQLVSSLGLLVVALMATGLLANNAIAQSDTNALRAFVSENVALDPHIKAGTVIYDDPFNIAVPAGKRFVIERVTGRIDTHDTLESVNLFTLVDSSMYGGSASCSEQFLSIPQPVTVTVLGEKLNVYNFDLARRIYADHGTTVQCVSAPHDFKLSVMRADSSKDSFIDINFTVSGYLVDLTTPIPIGVSALPTSPKPSQLSTSVVPTTAAVEPKVDGRRDTDFNIAGSSKSAIFLLDNSMR